MSTRASGLRARVRAEMVDEIKSIARRQLASEGANLSMRAVARDLGMVSSAVYRYFPSRDDLLTALIIDAYDAVGAAAEAADEGPDLLRRWLSVARAIRRWALENPHEYALIYGSPVPGYAAPRDTVPAATRTTAVFAGLLRDGVAAGRWTDISDESLPPSVRADLSVLSADPRFDGFSAAVFAHGLALWTQLFGMVSFELFGQFNNVINDRDEFFETQMRAAAQAYGLTA
jgi:AcrR family transcriptional regulator